MKEVDKKEAEARLKERSVQTVNNPNPIQSVFGESQTLGSSFKEEFCFTTAIFFISAPITSISSSSISLCELNTAIGGMQSDGHQAFYSGS